MFRIVAIARGFENDNPYTAMSHLRWRDPETGQTGIISRIEAYQYLKGQPWSLYVEDITGMKHYLMPIESDWGVCHVRTVSEDLDADEQDADPLLSLPEFL